jgi:site-specific recombinase XerC
MEIQEWKDKLSEKTQIKEKTKSNYKYNIQEVLSIYKEMETSDVRGFARHCVQVGK